MNIGSIFPDICKRVNALFIGLAFLVAMVGCGGGGGSGPDPEKNVTVLGQVDDGTANSPVSNAVCYFEEMNGVKRAQTRADSNGYFSIVAPPDTNGYIRCYPPNIPRLTLSTFLSTEGRAAGDKISGEDVTPTMTVVADIIDAEKPTFPLIRKLELVSTIVTGQDRNLNMVVTLSTWLYQTMLKNAHNVYFSGSSYSGGSDGGSDGGGGDSDGGGVGGDAGDGGDFSPIPNARCEFILGNDLRTGTALPLAALADFLDDGILNRPDLAPFQTEMPPDLQNNTPAEIKAAFADIFQNSLDQTASTTTDANGEYFLPVPPNVPGLVRCFPPDQEELILGTYVGGRPKGESLPGQDVTPATTFFTHVVARLLTDDLGTVKDNFLHDIDGLGDIHIVFDGEEVTGFELLPNSDPNNKEVGLVAFAATSLFNIFYKNGINVDYLAALDDLLEEKSVDPIFLSTLGVPADKTDAWAGIVNDSNDVAGQTLGVVGGLGTALSTARINVTVTDTSEGEGISDADIDIPDSPADIACFGCGTATDDAGEMTLTLTGVPAQATDVTVEASGVPGYATREETTAVVAFATVDLDIAMTPDSGTYKLSIQGTGDGGGTITGNTGGIRCSYDGDSGSGVCDADLDSGVSVTLTAAPEANSIFIGWSGDGCSGPGTVCTLSMDQAWEVTAEFALIPEVPRTLTVDTTIGTGSGTVTSVPGGIDCGANCSFDFEDGDTVELTAIADGDSSFVGWSGGCSGTATTCTVTMDQAQRVYAEFMLIPIVTHPLTVGKTGTGSGTVTSDPNGIDCGAICTYDFDEDQTVTLTASAADDSTFTNWIGAAGCSGQSIECTVTMDQAHEVTAQFTLNQYLLTVNKSGSGTGSVTSGDLNINCGSRCSTDSHAYNSGTSVTLTAAPTRGSASTSGSIFGGWSGDDGGCSDTNLNCTVTMDRARTITTRFLPNNRPTISSGYTLEIVRLSDPRCNLLGSDRLGSSFRIVFDFSDTDGNGPTTIYAAKLHVAYDFEYIGDGSFDNYTWNTTLEGDGYDGTIDTLQCYRFGDSRYVEVNMTIEDGAGAVSESLMVPIKRPDDAP